MPEASWEYKVDVMTDPDSTVAIDTRMAKLAAEGWELISGAAYSYTTPVTDVHGHLTAAAASHHVYVQYWRRAPIDRGD